MIRNFLPCAINCSTYSRNSENGGVGDDNVSLLQQGDAFGAAEVAVALEVADGGLVGSWLTVAILVPFVHEAFTRLKIVPAE